MEAIIEFWTPLYNLGVSTLGCILLIPAIQEDHQFNLLLLGRMFPVRLPEKGVPITARQLNRSTQGCSVINKKLVGRMVDFINEE